MNTEYRVEPCENGFLVFDPWGEIVDRYPSEEEARQNSERCKREDSIADNAHILVENAVTALMQLNGIDRDTAERAIRDAMGGA
jgi:hypothetical protein